MTANSRESTSATRRELVLTRVFDAPRELVFKAWTDPKHMAQWWGPNGFTNPVCELDARLGGAIRIDMRGPDGVVYPMGGKFHEIVEPERLVFTSTALHVAVLRATPEVAGALAGMEQGWSQSLDKLAAHLGHSEEESR